MPASYCEGKVWENSQSPYCCDFSLTPFTSPIVHFGLGMQHATKPSPTFFEIAVFQNHEILVVHPQSLKMLYSPLHELRFPITGHMFDNMHFQMAE